MADNCWACGRDLESTGLLTETQKKDLVQLTKYTEWRSLEGLLRSLLWEAMTQLTETDPTGPEAGFLAQRCKALKGLIRLPETIRTAATRPE